MMHCPSKLPQAAAQGVRRYEGVRRYKSGEEAAVLGSFTSRRKLSLNDSWPKTESGTPMSSPAIARTQITASPAAAILTRGCASRAILDIAISAPDRGPASVKSTKKHLYTSDPRRHIRLTITGVRPTRISACLPACLPASRCTLLSPLLSPKLSSPYLTSSKLFEF
jgi:hypothetical protein